jgi:cysteinyl-tRNA synthetase
MTLRLHNTLSKSLETFAPLNGGRVTFYTCGPTVYDYAHIGNFRSFLAADVLRRWLESPLCQRATPEGAPSGESGYDVRHVMNLTDVGHMIEDDDADGSGEDKMEAAQKRLLEDKKSGKLPEGVDETAFDPTNPYDIAQFYIDAFLEDAKALGLRVVREAETNPDLLPRPTEKIRGMLAMILTLLDKKCAYVSDDGVVYFDTQAFPEYGTLSGNTLDRLRAGAGGRVSDANQAQKKHPADFMLWKADESHLMKWDPQEVFRHDPALADEARAWGIATGYPGWHLECSVMARELLGDVIDIHSGGEDNIFPHHECEIAQSRCATGADRFARYWFHPRFLMVEGKKMSKSAGNFFTVRDLMARGFAPDAIRLELIKTHYRANANFTEQGLKDARRMCEKWRGFLAKADTSAKEGSRDDGVAAAFASAMDDDLNVAGAIGAVASWVNETPEPTRADAALMRQIDGVLGVLDLDSEPPKGERDAGEDAKIDELVEARQQARKNRDFAEADRIRDELDAMGVVVEDTPDGAKWTRKATL